MSSNLNLVKRIDKTNGVTFGPIAIASNSKEKNIYICDNLNHRILMADSDFNFIKSVGSAGKKINQFFYPIDICYKNGCLCLYICDDWNKRVQIFSKNI